jgi:MFS family permease
LIADYYPVEQRAKMNGLYQSGALVGALVGLVGGGVAVGIGGWHWAFLMWLPIGVAVALFVGRHRAPSRRVGSLDYEACTHRDVARELARIPSFWFGAMAITISQLLLNGLQFWGVPYFKRVHHLAPAAAGGLAALLGLGAAVGIVAGGFVSDRYMRRGVLCARVYVVAFASIAATVLLIPAFASTSLWVTSPLLLVGAMFLTLPVAPADAIVLDVVVAELRGRALAVRSIVRTVSNAGALVIGGISAALASTGLSSADSLRLAIVALTPIYAIGGVIMLLAVRTYPADVAFVLAESRRSSTTSGAARP